MLELLTRLLALEWRRTGAALREVEVGGTRIWYAEFCSLAAPRKPDPPFARMPWKRAFREGARRRRSPTVVLLHGMGASGASFFPVIGHLRQTYRVIVPDLPGHGWSRPPKGREFLTFAELLDSTEGFVEAVAPGGAYLAGNSMGGWIAAKLAARRPDLARGIALLNPGGPALDAEDWVEFGRVLSSEDADAIDQLVRRLFHRPPPVPDCGHCPQLECPKRTAEILLQLPRMRRRSRAA